MRSRLLGRNNLLHFQLSLELLDLFMLSSQGEAELVNLLVLTANDLFEADNYLTDGAILLTHKSCVSGIHGGFAQFLFDTH